MVGAELLHYFRSCNDLVHEVAEGYDLSGQLTGVHEITQTFTEVVRWFAH